MATEVWIPDARTFELHSFETRVLELVRLFHDAPVVRVQIIGTIAAGKPIEANHDPDDALELPSPLASARGHRLVPLLREYLCPSLRSLTDDAFVIARVITPLLAGLALSGKVPLDLNPWLFAGISILIARTGVAGFCAEHEGGTDTLLADDPLAEVVIASPQPAHKQRQRPHSRRRSTR